MKNIQKLFSDNIIICVIIMAAVTTIIFPQSLSAANYFNLLKDTSMVGPIALGMSLVILSGGIDLSVGSVFALGAIMIGLFLQADIGIVLALAATIIVCLLFGLLNGVIIAKGKVAPFIVTLASLMFVRGVVYIISGEKSVAIPGNVPQWFKAAASADICSLPVVFVIFVLLLLLVAFLLHYTQVGRTVFATGSSEAAAMLMGLSVNNAKIMVYALSAVFAGFAGILMAAKLGAGQVSAGNAYELKAILAAVIGGFAISGGIGKVRGVFFGALILQQIELIFNLGGVGTFYRNIILGVILLMIIVAQRVIGKEQSTTN